MYLWTSMYNNANILWRILYYTSFKGDPTTTQVRTTAGGTTIPTNEEQSTTEIETTVESTAETTTVDVTTMGNTTSVEPTTEITTTILTTTQDPTTTVITTTLDQTTTQVTTTAIPTTPNPGMIDVIIIYQKCYLPSHRCLDLSVFFQYKIIFTEYNTYANFIFVLFQEIVSIECNDCI